MKRLEIPPQASAARLAREIAARLSSPTYAAAHTSLQRLYGELRRLNEDAAKSLAEGLEETLTLHRLGLADRLGTSLSTTNGLESILALVEQRVGKVDRWTTSDRSSGGLRRRCWRTSPATPAARLPCTPATARGLEAGNHAGEGGEGSVMTLGVAPEFQRESGRSQSANSLEVVDVVVCR